MTHNQINYWNFRESERHNKVSEQEQIRHNKVGEGIDLSKVEESVRHNKATEGIDLGRLNETVRHNKVTESQTDVDLGIKRDSLSETIRHNLVGESISRGQLSAQLQNIAELARHNREQEAISWTATNAQAALNDSSTALNTIDADWRAVLNNSKNILNTSQYEKISQEISNLETQRQLLETQIKNGELNAAYKSYDEFLKGAELIIKNIDALIPGQEVNYYGRTEEITE